MVKTLGFAALLGVALVSCDRNADFEAPVVTVTNLMEGTEVQAGDTLVVEGMLTDNVELGSYTISVSPVSPNTGTFTITKRVDIMGESVNFSEALAIPTEGREGEYFVKVSAIDEEGNVGEATTVTIVVTESGNRGGNGGISINL